MITKYIYSNSNIKIHGLNIYSGEPCHVYIKKGDNFIIAYVDNTFRVGKIKYKSDFFYFNRDINIATFCEEFRNKLSIAESIFENHIVDVTNAYKRIEKLKKLGI